MVPLWSLPMLAALFVGCAAGLAALRRLGTNRALGDAAVAIRAAVISIAPGVSLYAAAAWSSDGAVWRNAGALCFVAFPSSLQLLCPLRRRNAAGAGVLWWEPCSAAVWPWLSLLRG